MKEIIGHCPYCTKILFKQASFKDEADFETICPYCGKSIMVQVEKQIHIIIKPKVMIDLKND